MSGAGALRHPDHERGRSRPALCAVPALVEAGSLEAHRADRDAGFAATAAALRSTTDVVVGAVRGLGGVGTTSAEARALAELIADLTTDLPSDDDRVRAALSVAAETAERVTALVRRCHAAAPGAFAPLTRLGSTVGDAHHLAVEAWIAAGPDGSRESLVPAHLLDLPAELVRIIAELDELATGRTRTRAREILAATDLLLGIGRDVGELVQAASDAR